MEENGIPLSLLNVGDFETEIGALLRLFNEYDKQNFNIVLNQKYKGIPIDREVRLVVFNGKIIRLYDEAESDDDDPLRLERGILLLYPKEYEKNLLDKGISKSVAFVDFLSLSTTPEITKSQAENISRDMMDKWSYFADKDFNKYKTELNYYNLIPEEPNDLTLVWITKRIDVPGGGVTVINAVTGELIRDFEGIKDVSQDDRSISSIKFYSLIFSGLIIIIIVFVVVIAIKAIKRKRS